MTEHEISEALRQHLASADVTIPTVWENAPGVWDGSEWAMPAPPFFVVSQVKLPPSRPGLDRWYLFAGRLVVSIMVEDGGFTAAAEGLAEDLVAHFEGLKIEAGGGVVTITDRPYSDDGYNDGAYWRINTHIRWEAQE